MNDQVTLGHARMPSDAAPAPPATMFIFGASGDLTKRLLMPAIYNLAFEGVLDPEFQIIGVDHIARSEDDYRAFLTDSVRALIAHSTDGTASIDEEVWSWLIGRIGYVAGDFDDPATYETLKARIVPPTTNSAGMTLSDSLVPPTIWPTLTTTLSRAGTLRLTMPCSAWMKMACTSVRSLARCGELPPCPPVPRKVTTQRPEPAIRGPLRSAKCPSGTPGILCMP